MKLAVCRNCAMHVLVTETQCPHCGASRCKSKIPSGKGAAFGMLLGLVTMVGCGEDEKSDSAESEPTTEPAPEAEPEASTEALYGEADPGE